MRSEQRQGVASDIVAFPLSRTSVKLEAQAAHQTLLDTVLNNMSQGVLMFDGRAQLVFFNQRYIEMYGLSPDVVVRAAGSANCFDTGKQSARFR